MIDLSTGIVPSNKPCAARSGDFVMYVDVYTTGYADSGATFKRCTKCYAMIADDGTDRIAQHDVAARHNHHTGLNDNTTTMGETQ